VAQAGRRPIRKFLGRGVSAVQRLLARHFDVVGEAQHAGESKFFRASPQRVAELLGGSRLQLFDVGARGGIETGWARYRDSIDATLAEPDPAEAARLGAAGYRVIPSLIGGSVGRGVLNLCEKGGSSSTLEPGGAFQHFYAAGATDRFRVRERIELPMTTVAAVVAARGAPFDYLKLDTQGSEVPIIDALGDALPLVIKTEVSFVPLYVGSGTLFDVGSRLWQRGYVLFHLAYSSRGAPARQRGPAPYAQTVLPMHGDAWFAPDWTRPAGQALIAGRVSQYRALMHVFALDDVAHYALAAGS
jgi:hypothetical protein